MNSESFKRVLRFVIAGSIAAATSATALHISIVVFDLWYITASVVGFFSGFLVSFTLQKFWTFRDTRLDVVGRQVLLYLGILFINLGSNTLLVYVGVEFGGLPPVVAQIGASLLIAFQNFFLYRYLIFRVSDTHEAPSVLS